MSADRSSRLAKLLVVAGWIAAAVTANLVLALLPAKASDTVSALLPRTAETAVANSRIAQTFPGTGSNAIAYLVLDSRDALGPADQDYYDAAVRALRADTTHVGSVLDWWSDPLTAQLGTGPDGRSGVAMVWLVGEAGSTQSQKSLDAARSVVRKLPPRAGLRVRVVVPSTTSGTPLRMSAWQGAVIVAAAVVIAILLLLRARCATKVLGIALLTAGLSLALAWPLIAAVWGQDGALTEFFGFSGTLAAVLTIGTITASTLLVSRHKSDTAAATTSRHRYRDAAFALAMPGMCVVLLTGPLLFAQTPTLHSVGTTALGVVVSLAASLTLLPALLGPAGPLAASAQRSSSQPGEASWTPPLSMPGVSRPVVVLATILAICALPVIGMRGVLAENPAHQAGTHRAQILSGLPDVVLIESDRDLRDPAGLIAIDRVSRRLMETPGVRKVQSAAWPAGVPWTEASLTSTAGRLSDQLDRQAATFVPQVNAIKTLKTVLDEVSGAVNEVEKSVHTGIAGLTEMQRDVDTLIAGARKMKDTTVQVSGYLDPVRGWIRGVANCPADVFCSNARKVVEPLDGVVAEVVVLSDGADRIAAVADRTVGAFASTPRVVAQMRSALDQLRAFVPRLESTIEDTLPQAVQMSAFLKNLSLDFADTGAGGFYLSRKALADPAYQNVRESMFSADGKATRLFVFSHQDQLDLNTAARAQQLEIAAGGVTKYGSLLDSRITVNGAAQLAAAVRGALTHDAALLAVTLLAVVALISMWRGGASGLVVGLGVLAPYLAALGIAVLLWQHLLDRDLQASVLPVSFAILAACGIPYLIACLVDSAAPSAEIGPVPSTVAPLMALGAVFGGGLMLVSVGSLGTLGEVGFVLVFGLGALFALARVCVPTAIAGNPNQRPPSPDPTVQPDPA